MENIRLTRHFNLDDFLASETAAREGIDNSPAPEAAAHIIQNLRGLCIHILEPVLDAFDTRPQITSGYRGPALNARVGGVATSQHCTGEAVDFQLPQQDLFAVAVWIKEHLTFDQLLLESNSKGDRWIHVSRREQQGENRQQIKTYKDSLWQEGLWP